MPITPNQSSEQRERDHIHQHLTTCGWIVQHCARLNLAAGSGEISDKFPIG